MNIGRCTIPENFESIALSIIKKSEKIWNFLFQMTVNLCFCHVSVADYQKVSFIQNSFKKSIVDELQKYNVSNNQETLTNIIRWFRGMSDFRNYCQATA